MRFLSSYATRSALTLAITTLAFVNCAAPEQDLEERQRADDLGGTPQTSTIPVCQGGRLVCKSHVRTDIHNQITSSATPQGLGPADLANAYALNAARSSTATIAIVVAFNYTNAESDLASYRSQFGLPPCTKASGCLTVLNQDGAASPLPGNSPPGDDWTIEAALDLDMASAACPTCKLILFEAEDDEGDGLFVAQNAAAATPGVVAISNSWGQNSDGRDATLDAQFFTHSASINTFVATGDSGYTGATPDYPSTSLHVIGVGGTRLERSTTARGWTETAWFGSGSSCSLLLAKPAFQPAVPSSVCAKRATADVAAVADPETGVAVFNAKAGGFRVIGGTSAASPFVAGVYARYSISGASHDASYAYGHASEFFDVTSGSNGSCQSSLCIATTGWDGPTGVGTPNGAKLGVFRGTNPAIAFGPSGAVIALHGANTDFLWTVSPDGVGHQSNPPLVLAPGTSPALVVGSSGTVIALHGANTDFLWTVSPDGAGHQSNPPLLLAPGTSPAIAIGPSGPVIAFHAAYTDFLWTVSPDGVGHQSNPPLVLAPGTSPAIAIGPGGPVIALHGANTDFLWTVSPDGVGHQSNPPLVLAPGTNPAIAIGPSGPVIALHGANTDFLWTVSPDGVGHQSNPPLVLAPGTSPAIAIGAGGPVIALHGANTDFLWTVGSDGVGHQSNPPLVLAPGTGP